MRESAILQCRSRRGTLSTSRCTLNVGHREVHFADLVEHEAYQWWLRRGQKPVPSFGPFNSRYISGSGRTSQAHVWILRLVIKARLARASRYAAERRKAKRRRPPDSPLEVRSDDQQEEKSK